jgi:DNA-directed RNA polymerase specialized sigma24 family protein
MNNTIHPSRNIGAKKLAATPINNFLLPDYTQLRLDAMSLSVLAERCMNEISNYCRGVTSNDQYGVELFRRATVDGEDDAWGYLQQCFGEMMRGWLRRHPSREAACRLDSEENYVAQAFERFWRATVRQRLEFSTLASALRYLHTCLNGAVMDMLRAYSRAKEAPLPEPGDAEEPFVEDSPDCGELWELLQRMLPNAREQRLAYLLFHCGLKPREILHYCPQEFSDVRDIYRMRRNIMERLLRSADYLRWQLITDSQRS